MLAALAPSPLSSQIPTWNFYQKPQRLISQKSQDAFEEKRDFQVPCWSSPYTSVKG